MLPYHPLDPEYEDYTYDEELEHVTQPFVPSQHIVSQLFINKTEKLFQSQITSQINIQKLIIYNKMVVLSFQISDDAFKCR